MNERKPPEEGARVASTCHWCGSPIWRVYHGPNANQTHEPRRVYHGPNAHEPGGTVRHGEPPCVCTDAGEDPHCPIHGYEAVIRRLRDENERLQDLLVHSYEAVIRRLRDESERLQERRA
jgi:hypothetical protein